MDEQLRFLILSPRIYQLKESELLARLGEFYVKGQYVEQDMEFGIQLLEKARKGKYLAGLGENQRNAIIKIYESNYAFFQMQKRKELPEEGMIEMIEMTVI